MVARRLQDSGIKLQGSGARSRPASSFGGIVMVGCLPLYFSGMDPGTNAGGQGVQILTLSTLRSATTIASGTRNVIYSGVCQS